MIVVPTVKLYQGASGAPDTSTSRCLHDERDRLPESSAGLWKQFSKHGAGLGRQHGNRQGKNLTRYVQVHQAKVVKLVGMPEELIPTCETLPTNATFPFFGVDMSPLVLAKIGRVFKCLSAHFARVFLPLAVCVLFMDLCDGSMLVLRSVMLLFYDAYLNCLAS